MSDSDGILKALAEDDFEKKILEIVNDQSLSDDDRIKILIEYMKDENQ